jgi:hypothetical protein
MGVEDHFYTSHASKETEWDKMADKNTIIFLPACLTLEMR